MDHIAQYILPNGQLNDRLIESREVLYRGMNGRCVERFTVQGNRSYVFKPLTNPSQKGKEAWIYQHVLPNIPPVYPNMLAFSSTDCEGEDWIVFEDVGKLRHRFDEKLLMLATKAMARWHATPVQRSWEEAGLSGPKPPFSAIAAEVLEKEAAIHRMFVFGASPVADAGISIDTQSNAVSTYSTYSTDESLDGKLSNHVASAWPFVQAVLTDYASQPSLYQFNEPRVLSHGDLHLGNIAYREAGTNETNQQNDSLEQIIIIDWEHAHPNHRYWDLYHLIDLSHPLYPKSVDTPFRERILLTYWQEVHAVENEVKGALPESQHTYTRQYYLFATIFSMWMLLLISKDLKQIETVWPKAHLRRQFSETLSIVIQCAQRYAQLK